MTEEFTDEELEFLRFYVRNRLRYESRRPRYIKDGVDLTTKKVRLLVDLSEKIERIILAR